MIYLDNAATTWPKPDSVPRAMMEFVQQCGANPGRGGYQASLDAARIVFHARQEIASLVGAVSPLHVIFTKNATEALNIALFGSLEPGDHVVCSVAEHNSVLRPLHELQSRNINVTYIAPCSDGSLDPSDVERAICTNTRLIALTHASNVLGTVNPIARIGEIACKHDVLFCVDAAQTAGAVAIDCASMHIDCLAFSGHKSLYGPQGTGALVVSKRAAECLRPLILGGTGSASASDEHPRFLPDAFEAGTCNAVGIAGLLAAVQFVTTQSVSALRSHDIALTSHLVEGLRRINEISVLGHAPSKSSALSPPTGVVSFVMSNMTSEQVATLLEQHAGVCCRAGLHCAPRIHKHLGTFPDGAVRLSVGAFTTTSQLDVALQCLRDIARDRLRNQIDSQSSSQPGSTP